MSKPQRQIEPEAADAQRLNGAWAAINALATPDDLCAKGRAGYDRACQDIRVLIETAGGRETSHDLGALALRSAKRALDLIVGEAPEAEPVYPEGGDTDACEAWAMDSAHWNTAATARPALDAVNLALRAAKAA